MKIGLPDKEYPVNRLCRHIIIKECVFQEEVRDESARWKARDGKCEMESTRWKVRDGKCKILREEEEVKLVWSKLPTCV